MAYSATLAFMLDKLSQADQPRILTLISRAGLSIDHELFTESLLAKCHGIDPANARQKTKSRDPDTAGQKGRNGTMVAAEKTAIDTGGTDKLAKGVQVAVTDLELEGRMRSITYTRYDGRHSQGGDEELAEEQ
ncbi:hypothetical protein BDZ91DRAFT_797516 [Kalaharituber pfeilii]|nr:hypothetical protein BDZ91DRAFT_797516 [Kalaharituber pfeilii]